MKLYIYEHCPFCIRVRYVAKMLDIALQEIIVDYHDKETPTQLVGKKVVPILIKDDGTPMLESSDIIDYFISLKHSYVASAPIETTLQWQKKAFPLLQRIGYPRWLSLKLAEFSKEESHLAWVANKQTSELNFERLLEQTEEIAKDVETLANEAEKLLNFNGTDPKASLVDQAIYYSILSGVSCEPTINWPEKLLHWLNVQSESLTLPLIKSY